jgi:hypothetical protein
MPLSSVLFDFKFSVNCEFWHYILKTVWFGACCDQQPSSGQGGLIRVSQNGILLAC